MVPLNDQNPTRLTPYVTYALIAINILVFVYELSLTPQQLDQFFHLYALVPRELSLELQGGDVPQSVIEPLTLLTSQFLHGGFAHVAFNMLFLWVFGNNVEDKLGHVKYLVFYLACGVAAALAQYFFSTGSSVPSLGASGAIAGVLGAYILRFPNARITVFFPPFFVFPVPAFYFLGFWFLQQSFNGLASLNAPSVTGMEQGGVAYWAHVGGFVAGLILGPLMGLFSDSQARREV